MPLRNSRCSSFVQVPTMKSPFSSTRVHLWTKRDRLNPEQPLLDGHGNVAKPRPYRVGLCKGKPSSWSCGWSALWYRIPFRKYTLPYVDHYFLGMDEKRKNQCNWNGDNNTVVISALRSRIDEVLLGSRILNSLSLNAKEMPHSPFSVRSRLLCWRPSTNRPFPWRRRIPCCDISFSHR